MLDAHDRLLHSLRVALESTRPRKKFLHDWEDFPFSGLALLVNLNNHK